MLTAGEVRRILDCIEGVDRLFLSVLYGTGMRLAEALRLRVQDLDFEYRQITVRNGKGAKDRMTMLPDSLKADLLEHLQRVKKQHASDLQAGYGLASLPYALSRKYSNAAAEWNWQFVFPAPTLYTDEKTGEKRRHHMHERGVQRAFHVAARKAGITKHATCHTLRHYAELGIIATVLPPTCWSMVRNSLTSKSCSVIAICKPRCCTPVSLRVLSAR